MVAIKARYKGRDGEFYEGIPARDLSEEDYTALPVEQKRQVLYGSLYAMVDDKPKAAKGPAADGEQPAAEAPAEAPTGEPVAAPADAGAAEPAAEQQQAEQPSAEGAQSPPDAGGKDGA